MAFAGYRPPRTWDSVEDQDGVRFGAALREHLAAESDIPRRPLGVVEGRAPHAYVEAHIEQGPRLEAEGRDIGAVTGIPTLMFASSVLAAITMGVGIYTGINLLEAR